MNGKRVRIYCKSCGKKTSINNKQNQTEKLFEAHLNRNSYRQLERDTGVSKKTICSLTNDLAAKLIDSNELTAILRPQNYCGTLLTDGKYLKVKYTEEAGKELVVIPFIDYLTHDIPVCIVAH